MSATARVDLAVAGIIATLGVAVWVESGTWGQARNLAQDPTVLPRGIAVVLGVVAVSMVLRVLRGRRGLAPPRSATDDLKDEAARATADASSSVADGGDGNLVGALAAFALLSLYAWLAFRVGWIVTTWLFILGGVVGLGRERWSAARLALVAAIGLAATAIVWFGFVELLNVRMPSTLLL